MEDEKNSNLVLLRAKPPKKIKRFVFHFLLVIISLTLFFLILNKDLVSEHFQNLKIISKISTENLIKNGDFEDEKISAEDKKLPIGWDLIGDCKLGEGITIETISQADLIVFGKQSLKITANKDCGIAQKINFPRKEFYKIEIQVQEVDGKATAIFKDEAGKTLFQSLFNERSKFQVATIPINGSLIKNGTLEIVTKTISSTFIVDGIAITKLEFPKGSPKFFDDFSNTPENQPAKSSEKNSFIYNLFRKAEAAPIDHLVQPLYFVPGDMEVYSQYTNAIISAMEQVKAWYARELWGRTFSTEAILVYHDSWTYDQIRCGNDQECIRQGRVNNYWRRVESVLPPSRGRIRIVFGQGVGGVAGGYTYIGSSGGFAMVGDFVLAPISGGFLCPRCLPSADTYGHAIWTIGHELGHCFDLPHPPVALDQSLIEQGIIPPGTIMGAEEPPYAILYDFPDYSEKRRLLGSYFFGNQPPLPSSPEIDWVEPRTAVRAGLISINGSNFCDFSPNESKVYLGNAFFPVEDILSWNFNHIEAIIPQETQSSNLRVKTGDRCGNKYSNDYLISVFDKPIDPIQIEVSPPARVFPGLELFWKRKPIVGNFGRVFFNIYEIKADNTEEIRYTCHHPDCFDRETIIYQFGILTNFDAFLRQMKDGSTYKWEFCAYNYYERKNYCKNGNFTFFSKFLEVTEPLHLELSAQNILHIAASLKPRVPESIELITLWYRSKDADPSKFDQVFPTEGWKGIMWKLDCPENPEETCYFNFDWRIPNFIQKGEYFFMMDVISRNNNHFLATGGPSRDSWFQTPKLLASFYYSGYDSSLPTISPPTPTPTSPPDPRCSCQYSDSWPAGNKACIDEAGKCFGPDERDGASWNYESVGSYCYIRSYWCDQGGAPKPGSCNCPVAETQDVTDRFPDSYRCQGKNNIFTSCHSPYSNYPQDSGWERKWISADGGRCFKYMYRCGGVIPTPTPTSRPTLTPTPLPQFGVCGGCDHDAWGGCTQKEECRLINDADLCGRNHKPGTPCCLRDRCCNPSACQQSCGYGDPNTYCQKCTRFWNNPPNGPWCTNWDLGCGTGKPAKPRLKGPANNASITSNSSPVNLSWYAFGEGLPNKCGEQLEGNWPKWDDCHNSWHWGTPASCISEIGDGSNAGDRSCWGYVCAKGSFGIPSNWRQYKVLLKDPQDNDFREICQIEDVPNPSTIGQGLASNKTSCSFTPSSNGNYQWFVRAGYVVSTAGGISYNFTDSSPYSFSVSGLISPTPTFTVTPIPTLTFTPTPTSTLTLVPSVTPRPTNTPTRSPTSGLTPTATSQPTNVPTNTPTRAPTATPIGPTATPTAPPPTPTPTYIAQCRYCRVYDKDWVPVIDINKISVGDELFFTTRGSTDHPQGIAKARFRINGKANLIWCRGTGLAIVNNWCETSLVHKQVEYYLPYKISEPGYYTVGSMVYNPDLGWF